jgi:outer membrane protein assembly factor BamC
MTVPITMKKLHRWPAALALALAVALTACGTSGPTKSRINYQSAGAAPPPLDIPPDLSRPRTEGGAAAPGGTRYSDYSASRQPPAAPVAGEPRAVTTKAPAMRIERSGTQRWLVIEGESGPLWSAVRGFFTKSGLAIAFENREAGILETDWADNRAKIHGDFIQRYLTLVFPNLYSSGVRDKFRVRLERGQTPGTTEIYLSHRGLVETIEGNPALGGSRVYWQPRPADPEVEAEMLRLLMVHLGAEDREAEKILAAIGPERARLARNARGEPVLNLDDNLERAWPRVGLTLDRVGFMVEDRDRANSIYYVRYNDPAREGGEKKGFFSWLVGDDQPLESRYQITLAVAGTGTEVGVRDSKGTVDRSATAERMLKLLYEELK